MDKNIRSHKLYLIVVLFALSSYTSFSQGFGGPPDPSSGGAGFDDDIEDQIVPIDGLVLIGMIAGSIYGIRKKYKN